jgi:hypothetical protein
MDKASGETASKSATKDVSEKKLSIAASPFTDSNESTEEILGGKV